MEYDLIIIGAGPVGLHAAFLAGYMQLKTLCIEQSDSIGGQPAKMYPNKPIYDWPGYSEITGLNLINKLKQQVDRYQNNVKIKTNINIVEHNINENLVILKDDKNNIYKAKFLLICCGLGSYSPRKIDCNIENEHSNIHYNIHDDKTVYDNKKIIVLGGGDSAIDYAVEIAKKSKATSVDLIHHKAELSSETKSVDYLIQNNINVHLDYELKKLSDDKIHLVHKINQENKCVFADLVLVQYGHDFSPTYINKIDDLIKKDGKFIVDENYNTSNPLVFAAGSCVYKPNRINMIITGCSEATIALNKIKSLLPETKKIVW